ncbi:MAG: hypothetical protein AAF497_04350 [Planctomycetota bacterium]
MANIIKQDINMLIEREAKRIGFSIHVDYDTNVSLDGNLKNFCGSAIS